MVFLYSARESSLAMRAESTDCILMPQGFAVQVRELLTGDRRELNFHRSSNKVVLV